ncbi:hypothetical protein C8F01DRAFT_1249361 [Mycena amicta]|nr:hypothetical protein C8F01DRAFT_1249361 [Mycena amicta]
MTRLDTASDVGCLSPESRIENPLLAPRCFKNPPKTWRCCRLASEFEAVTTDIWTADPPSGIDNSDILRRHALPLSGDDFLSSISAGVAPLIDVYLAASVTVQFQPANSCLRCHNLSPQARLLEPQAIDMLQAVGIREDNPTPFSQPAPRSTPSPFRGPHLESFVVKYPDRQMSIPVALTTQLAALHGPTLLRVSFINCVLGVHDTLPALCEGCPKLERLEVALPVRDMTMFTIALTHARALRVLVDVESHSTSAHSPRPSLTQDTFRNVFASVPTLMKVSCEGTRVWSRGKTAQGGLLVSLERKPGVGAGAGALAGTSAGMHWFMPREM